MKTGSFLLGIKVGLIVTSGDGLSPLCFAKRSSTSKTRLHESKEGNKKPPDGSVLLESESNFWFTVTEKVDDQTYHKVPSVRSLDADGPLPPNAYRLLGLPQHEPVQTCLATVAVDLTKKGLSLSEIQSYTLDPDFIVKDMQRFIDSGLTTFHLKTDRLTTATSVESEMESSRILQEWGEENVYGRLRHETPASVLRGCHFVVPIQIPFSGSISPVSSARRAFLSSLRRMGTECADSVQLKYCPGSPYHLDVLDMLSDLQREGLVRSISGTQMPVDLIRSAEDCGFHLDSYQVSCNLLDPTQYSRDQKQVCSDFGGTLLLSSPLCGGLLTERHLNEEHEPPMPWDMTPVERTHQQTTLRKWAGKHAQEKGSAWQRYQRVVMKALEEIAFKHEVSISSVALRWTMQLEHMGSVVSSCTLGRSDGRPHNRQQALREVFRFELDEEDMERLWFVSGRVKEPDVAPGGLDGADLDALLSQNKNLWI